MSDRQNRPPAANTPVKHHHRRIFSTHPSSIMKFITSLLTLALASMALACSEEQDCCWSSEEACYRQHGISWVCEKQSYKDDFCYNRGVYLKDCDADCCSISKKIGIPCP
ncbi:hypothetical protein BKA81DRAFT_359501 [Phyllosticta paracitricarpa]